uniref:SPIN-DOC-like zinc-finger domain-containing protein n=1 Tax=Denticeps clupeoides TaxID=299321 RepID=A0AAY4A5W4_9TELE
CAGGADGEQTPESGSGRATPSPPAPDPAAPSARTLERYLNDSLHAWFRQEFLMEYQADAGRLVCMVCGNPLPSLHLDHIKSHVLDVHPSSLVYSSEEKHCILQSWARTHGDGFVEFFPREADGLSGQGSQTHTEASVPEEAGTSEDAKASPSRHRARRKKSLKGGFPWRLRMDYLVAYGPDGCGCFCMVCSQALPVAKVAGFRRHIQDCHPKTTGLSRREREEVAEAWVRDVQLGGREDQMLPGEAGTFIYLSTYLFLVVVIPPDDVARIPDETSVPAPQAKATRPVEVKKEDGLRTKGAAEEGTALAGEATAGRHGHYPGKDQRRNYQVRWRMEYLMDYDCRRHGLICMVCGATLATLKVSTIKRHIQQVHPHSLAYGPEEKQQALEGYNQTALHFVHSEDCFSAQDPGHGPRAGTAAGHASLFVP